MKRALLWHKKCLNLRNKPKIAFDYSRLKVIESLFVLVAFGYLIKKIGLDSEGAIKVSGY
jgi:hypothetical protein